MAPTVLVELALVEQRYRAVAEIRGQVDGHRGAAPKV